MSYTWDDKLFLVCLVNSMSNKMFEIMFLMFNFLFIRSYDFSQKCTFGTLVIVEFQAISFMFMSQVWFLLCHSTSLPNFEWHLGVGFDGHIDSGYSYCCLKIE